MNSGLTIALAILSICAFIYMECTDHEISQLDKRMTIIEYKMGIKKI